MIADLLNDLENGSEKKLNEYRDLAKLLPTDNVQARKQTDSSDEEDMDEDVEDLEKEVEAVKISKEPEFDDDGFQIVTKKKK